METAQGDPENSGAANLKKWGPLGLILAVAIVVIIIVASGGGDGDDSVSEPSSSSSSSSSQSASADTSEEESAEEAEEAEAAEEETTENSEEENEETTPATEDCPTAGDARDDLLTGVMFYEEAVTRCIVDDIDWGERCDEETGQLLSLIHI